MRLNNDRSGTTTINGTSHSLFLPASDYGPARMDILIGEGTVDVGSAKTITISSVFNMEWTLRGYSVTQFSASDSITLESIMEAPNAPTGVSLSNPSGTSLSLSWSHSTTSLRPVDDFEVQRSVNGGAYSGVTTTSSKSITGSGSRGSSYQYRVRARNAAGSSAWAYSNTVTIPYLPPNTPSLSSSQSGTTADLSWSITTSSDRPIDNFYIDRRVNGGSWAHLTSPASGSRSYTNSGLTRGSTYEYRIKAQGPGGDSGWSGIVSERIPYLPPTAPSDVSVSRSAYNRFALTWGAAPTSDRPIDSFDIYRSVNGGSFSKIANVSGSTRSYNDDTVELGKTYQYYVVAINVDASTQSSNSNALTNPAGVPITNGSVWNIYPVYVYDGTNWVYRPVYVYNGTVWHWRG
ncbi:fibronectin type III domain-containing protein [Heyndrickxia sporothermodurans]|uniref:fibronectin type III domain-containing protein n=1 Tax=Heyndrickxia sporothermodurans TaxID=46224 RepID=UPI0013FD6E5B|nr:fibronectin type III domain-containing protein [Heyndrickxia sporothermodurans]